MVQIAKVGSSMATFQTARYGKFAQVIRERDTGLFEDAHFRGHVVVNRSFVFVGVMIFFLWQKVCKAYLI